ncbi:hypothetical protein AAG906_003334 [Vitis piasezkii]
MGDLHYFHGIKLSIYIWDLLTCTKLDGAKEVIIRLSTPTSFTLHDSLPISCTIQLRSTAQQISGKRDDRTSTTTYIVYLSGKVISWCYRKKKYVAQSSMEDEYHVLACTSRIPLAQISFG